jgi:hypothetical protein
MTTPLVVATLSDPAGERSRPASMSVHDDLALAKYTLVCVHPEGPRRGASRRIVGGWPLMFCVPVDLAALLCRPQPDYRPSCSPIRPLMRMWGSQPTRKSSPRVTRSATRALIPPPAVNAPSLDV